MGSYFLLRTLVLMRNRFLMSIFDSQYRVVKFVDNEVQLLCQCQQKLVLDQMDHHVEGIALFCFKMAFYN